MTVTPDDVKRIAVRATALAGEDDTPWRRAVVAALGQAGLATGFIRGGGHLAPLDARPRPTKPSSPHWPEPATVAG